MLARRIWRKLVRTVRRPPVHVPRSIPRLDDALVGVDVLGFFTSEHGVGEAARSVTHSLRTASVPVSTIDYTDTQSRREHEYLCDNVSKHRVLLASINSDQLTAAHHLIDADFFTNRYVIGQWFWELEQAPPWFGPAFPLVNELWAPTRFIEAMLRGSAPPSVHVEHVPLPVIKPDVDPSIRRADFGLDDRFMFLFVFDFMSVMKRKNPLGLVEAFSNAFAEGEGPQLVIKAINGDKRQAEHEALARAVASRSDVTLIDRYFSRLETSTLIGLSDCYVSLHRSEGLGLTMSEAMALGVPVIASNYSGNLDFMNEDNSFLVPTSPVQVGEGAEGYSPTAVWREPDLVVAGELMRSVLNDPMHAADMGRRGQHELLSSLTAERCGAIMRRRLEEIWRSLND